MSFRCAREPLSSTAASSVHSLRGRCRRHRRLWLAERFVDEVCRSAVQEWLEVADVDRNTATACLAVASLHPSVAFHCQQALEKLLKGFLTLAGKRSRKTHSLKELGAIAEASFPEIADLVAPAKDWSGWAVDYHYPSPRRRRRTLPGEDELRRALAVIDALAAELRAANPEPPVRPGRPASSA